MTQPITFEEFVAQHPYTMVSSSAFEPVDAEMERQVQPFIAQGLLTKQVEKTFVYSFTAEGKAVEESEETTWTLTEKGTKKMFLAKFSLLEPITQTLLMNMHNYPCSTKGFQKLYYGPLTMAKNIGEKAKEVSKAYQELQSENILIKQTRYGNTFYKATWKGRQLMDACLPGADF